jgi:hypothetical protein
MTETKRYFDNSYKSPTRKADVLILLIAFHYSSPPSGFQMADTKSTIPALSPFRYPSGAAQNITHPGTPASKTETESVAHANHVPICHGLSRVNSRPFNAKMEYT